MCHEISTTCDTAAERRRKAALLVQTSELQNAIYSLKMEMQSINQALAANTQVMSLLWY